MKSISKKTSVGFAFGVLLILLANGAVGFANLEDVAPSQENGQEYGATATGSFYVPRYGSYSRTLLTSLQSSKLYNVAVGLQITGPDDTQHVDWGIECDSTEAVAQAVFDWVGYKTIWQSLMFISRSSNPSGCSLKVWNNDGNGQTFYYYLQYSVFETMTKTSTATDYSSTFSAYSGSTRLVTTVYPTANKLSFYEVAMNYAGSSGSQVKTNVAFECYDGSYFLAYETRHVKYWEAGGTWTIMLKVIVPADSSGAYCQLKVTHQESGWKYYTARIRHYVGSETISRQLESSGERSVRISSSYAWRIDTSLAGGYDYLAVVRIYLSGSDYQQRLNWFVGIGYYTYDLGLKDGHSVKYWTNYRMSGSTTLGGSQYYTNDAWVQLYNYGETQTYVIKYYIWRWA